MPRAVYQCVCGQRCEVRYVGTCKTPPKVYCVRGTKTPMRLTSCVPSGDTKVNVGASSKKKEAPPSSAAISANQRWRSL